MRLQISTIEKTTYQANDIKSVSIPTQLGEITVLDRHIPLVSLIQAGVLRLEHGDGREEFIALAGGLLEVRTDEGETVVVVLADTADLGREIDQERVEVAKARAAEALRQPEKLTEVEYRQLVENLATQEAKLKAAVKTGNVS